MNFKEGDELTDGLAKNTPKTNAHVVWFDNPETGAPTEYVPAIFARELEAALDALTQLKKSP